jgi:hypothetical protein
MVLLKWQLHKGGGYALNGALLVIQHTCTLTVLIPSHVAARHASAVASLGP